MPDEVDYNLTGYKDRIGDRIPPGRYRVQVEDAEVDRAGSGNVMVNMWFRVVGGEHDGAVIIDRLVVTEKSLWRSVAFMQAIGVPTPRKKFRINVKQRFVGKTLDVDVDDGDPYNGRVKSEVRGYMRIYASEQPEPATETTGSETESSGMDVFAQDENEDTSDSEGEVDLDKIDL